ncbi:serine/threonine-protein phosphatase 6 regulatory ankyrin repeat subunit B-like [Saccostrea cucullata]|uniref:serine/threonine-protein phosphatase 6 regulatory ankyrin repeat subunit B-like n=1 Tax=Saccostrea cuccullata TaxID=36930 RepID=UPI002ED6146C
MGAIFSAMNSSANPAESNEQYEAVESIRNGDFYWFKAIYNRNSRNVDNEMLVSLISLIIQYGRVKFLKFLLEEENCNVHIKENGSRDSLLHLCSNSKTTNNTIDCCKVLLANKIDINVKNVWGRTPLIGALVAFRYKLAKVLIAQNADVNICDSNGLSPVIICCSYGNLELLELLVQNGASINQTNSSGKSALHYAIVGNHTEIIDFLLKKNCEINTMDKYGITPLHVAICKFNVKATERLIMCGKSVENEAFSTSYVDYCLKIVWSTGIRSITLNEQILQQASNSLTCMRMVVRAFGFRLKPTVLEKLRRLESNFLGQGNSNSKELMSLLSDLCQLISYVEKVTQEKRQINSPESLQAVCVHRCRELWLKGNTNVLYMCNRLQLPQYTNDMLTLASGT